MATPAPKKLEPVPTASQIKIWGDAHGLRSVNPPNDKGILAVDGNVEGQHFSMLVQTPVLSYIRGIEVRARWRFRITGGLMGGIVSRPLFNMLRDPQTMNAFKIGNEIEEERVIRSFDETQLGNPAVRRHFAAFGNMAQKAESWVDDELAKMLLFWPNDCYTLGQPFMLLVVNGQLMMIQQLNQCPIYALNHVMKTIRLAADRAAKTFGQSDTYR